jgi:cyclopropane fatty-acyl-phospholipid synthase-like methyltransferase
MSTAVDTLQVLHLGCGRKRYAMPELAQYVGLTVNQPADVTHLDADARLNPDLVCTLGRDPIALPDNSVDVIVAWHVLEHIGKQGEIAEWFQFWEEAYRVLKPNGWIYAESPYYTGIWAWSDPTHARALSEHSFIFFAQGAYRQAGSMISPYRIACDFQW